jgi:peptidoglycan/LPS O-acetylase OafA/YrhL
LSHRERIRVTEKSGKADTIKALAGARGFPPLMVILFHFSEGHHYSGWRWLDLAAARGYLWVEFFFVLSGFILTHAYWDRMGDLLGVRGYGAFLRARLIRLYPLHLFMLLLILAMVLGLRALAAAGGYVSIFDLPWHQDVSAKGFAFSVFLIHAWNTMDRLTWNGASWFVSVEFALCLLFPLLLWLARGGRSGGHMWRGLALMAAGLSGLTALLMNSRHGLDITFHNGVLRGLSDFTVGAGMAVLFRHLKRRDRLPEGVHSMLQCAVLMLLALATWNTGWSHTRNDIHTALALMLLVWVLAFDRGIIANALKARLPQRMGEWSYAVYIGQAAWLLGIRYFEQRLYPPPDAMVMGMPFERLIWGLEPALLLLVCVAWGAFLAEVIEIPVANALRKRFGRRLDRPEGLTPS